MKEAGSYSKVESNLQNSEVKNDNGNGQHGLDSVDGCTASFVGPQRCVLLSI